MSCPDRWNEIRLIAFDVDGTLVENDKGLVVWQLLNDRYVGDNSLNAARYQKYLEGALSYAEWVRLDVEGWQQGGATREDIASQILTHLRLVPAAREVTSALAQRGYQLAVISGTLDIVLEVLFPDHPFQHVFTNRIAFDTQGAIHSWQATPYDMEGKADALRHLSSALHIPFEEIAFVGDNINDCAALQLVGRPVAYDPKHQSVRAAAKCVLPRGALVHLLDFLPCCPKASCADSSSGR